MGWDGTSTLKVPINIYVLPHTFSVVITCFGYLEGLGTLTPTHIGEVVIRQLAFAPQDVNGNDTQQASEFHRSPLP